MPPLLPPALLLLTILLLVPAFRSAPRTPLWKTPVVWMCAFLSGITARTAATGASLPCDGIGCDSSVVLQAEVIDIRRGAGNRCQLVLLPISLAGRDTVVRCIHPPRVLLRCPATDTIAGTLTRGTFIAVAGHLERPRDTRNPGEFSERDFLEANGIGYLFLPLKATPLRIVSSPASWSVMADVIDPVRRAIVAHIDRTIGGKEGEFLKGLLLGERSGFEPETRELLVNAGVAHILAVSGSNVAVVAAFVMFLTGILRLPAAARALLLALVLVFYMLLTGSQPPVVRATASALLILAGRWLQVRADPLNTIGVAAALMLMINPAQLHDVGFQLSFSAVAAIVYVHPRVNPSLRSLCDKLPGGRLLLPLLQIGTVSLAASMGTLPVAAASFGKVSIIGVAANAVVVPLSGVCVILGGITSLLDTFSPEAAEVYANLNWLLLHLSLRTAEFAGGLPFAALSLVRFPPAFLIPLLMTMLLLVNFRTPRLVRKYTWLTLISAQLALVAPTPEVLAPGTGVCRLTFLDVGQGDAAVVETPSGNSLVVDAGGRWVGGDAASRVVIPFLQRRGIANPDLVLLTHMHDDHTGGAPSLLRSHPPGMLVLPGHRSSLSWIRRHGETRDVPCMLVTAGECLALDSTVRIYVLAPARRGPGHDPDSRGLNHSSVVLRVVYGRTSIVLSGDAEEEEERDMVDRYGSFLASDCLKTGHHGSITSSSRAYLEAVRPRLAVVSVGRNNRHGHPSAVVLARLASSGADVARTDEEGAVMVVSDGSSLVRPFW